MGVRELMRKVKRVERSVRLPVRAAADTRPMIALLTLLAGDDGLWRDWIGLSGGGAAVDPSLLGGLAARINAASAAETAAGRADPCALRIGSEK